MRRNAMRADAIREMLIDACESLQLGILYEGAGLPK